MNINSPLLLTIILGVVLGVAVGYVAWLVWDYVKNVDKGE